MAWYRCTGGNGGGGGAVLITKNITENGTYNASSDNADGYSSVNVNVSGGGGDARLELEYQATTSGTSTYTIVENGVYLVAVVYSHNGTASYSLPSGRTPHYANDFIMGGTMGVKLAVVTLEPNDVVTMTSTPASWVAFAKVIIKLPTVVDTLIDSVLTNAQSPCEYTLSTGSGTVLCLMFCWSRFLNGTNLYDYTAMSKDIDMLAGYVGVNTLMRIFTCDVTDFPSIKAYGYDGGGTVVAVLQ